MGRDCSDFGCCARPESQFGGSFAMNLKRPRSEDGEVEGSSLKKMKRADIVSPSTRASHWAWSFGGLLASDTSHAVCRLCGLKVAYGTGSIKSVGTLQRHLETIHKVTAGNSLMPKVAPISSFYTVKSESQSCQQLWLEKLATFITKTGTCSFLSLFWCDSLQDFQSPSLITRIFRS